MLTVLAGGVGAARFLSGFVPVVRGGAGEEITVIGNTGDDFTHYGLHISPDLDIVAYTLAGRVNPTTGWGFANDTDAALTQLREFAGDDGGWFHLGDKDLGTHLYRTGRLHDGATLAHVTDEICAALDVPVRLIPMTNDPVATHIKTKAGWMHFEEYLVKHRSRPRILDIRLKGARAAKPAPGVLTAIRNARAVVVPPSNPFVSIGTILSIPGMRRAVRGANGPVVAVSPIVGGTTVKGPADKMMRARGLPATVVGVGEHYAGLVDALIIDRADARAASTLEDMGYHVTVMNTLMDTARVRTALARAVLDAIDTLR